MKSFKIIFIALLCALCQMVRAQVPQKTIVEHFTNTKCSICASRNPGFYTNLRTQANTLHLSVFPSAPYAACLLSQQNAAAADARTNFYGIYGGTPRLVINGNVVGGSTNYADTAIFAPYKALTSPASLRMVQTKYSTDSIVTRITIKTEASHNLGQLSLFLALTEDTVFYTGSNNEAKHYDVFRKALTAPTGDPFLLPSTIGDSVVLTYKATPNAIWNLNRIFTTAILQQTNNKSLVQAEKSNTRNIITNPSGVRNDARLLNVQISPNPASNFINVKLAEKTPFTLNLYNAQGMMVLESKQNTQNATINLASLPSQMYFIKITSAQGYYTQKIIKQD